MKRIPVLKVILLLMVFGVSITSAQEIIVAKGFKGGINFANVYNNNSEDTDTRTGIILGGFVTLRAYKQFYVQPEILYISKGFITKASDYQSIDSTSYSYSTENEFILNYLEIPILGMVEINKHIRLYGGPYFDFFIDGKKKLEFIGQYKYYDTETRKWVTNNMDDSNTKKIKSSDMNNPGFGVFAGTELVFGQVSVGVRYAMGMSNAPNSDTVDFRHKLFQVLVGYTLP